MDMLYRTWVDFYNIYRPFVDEAYLDKEKSSLETKKLKEIFQHCDYILYIAKNRGIILDDEVEFFLAKEITNVKTILDKISVTDYDKNGEEIKKCNDVAQIRSATNPAKNLLKSLQNYFFPLFFQVFSEKQQHIDVIAKEIKEIRNEEVIKSLSTKFKSETKLPFIVNVVISVIILLSIGLFLYFILNRELPTSKELTELIFFYVKQSSILILFGIFLQFLFILRKEFSRLEQSYRHKEVLASSFINFQEQISKMPDSIKEEKLRLNSKLLEITIEELGKNPIDKLDDKNKGNKDLIILENNLLEKIILKLLDKKA